jgi:hypothetical protein
MVSVLFDGLDSRLNILTKKVPVLFEKGMWQDQNPGIRRCEHDQIGSLEDIVKNVPWIFDPLAGFANMVINSQRSY